MLLGSSQCEIRAVAEVAKLLHNRFRKCKETAPHSEKMTIDLGPVLKRVGASLQKELTDDIKRSVAMARKKLVRPGHKSLQWKGLRILTGGGGANDALYTGAAQNAFAPWNIVPELLPLPLPSDLDWPTGTTNPTSLFRRFGVAYGLSFDRTTLEDQRYPDETGPFPSGAGDDEPTEPRYTAPTKDEV
jgi:hypothetical protein